MHDRVMGGMSTGRMVASEFGLRFEGVISLENNGGFASVRRPLVRNLAAARGVRLRVRGDGRRYQFRLRPDERPDSIAWRVQFDSTDHWRELTFGWADFEAVFRGTPTPRAGPVVPADIRLIGFMLADGKAGTFRLEISSVDFF